MHRPTSPAPLPCLPGLLALLVAATWAGPAAGASIPVVNPSFEAPLVGDGTFAASPPGVGWQFFGNALAGDPGIQNPGDVEFTGASDQTPDLDTTIPDGRNTGYLNNLTVIRQVLTSSFKADRTYTFSLQAGWRLESFVGAPTFELLLLRGDTLAPLASRQVTLALRDLFTPHSVSFAAGAAEAGLPIAIEMRSLDATPSVFTQANFDSVAVSAVPEARAHAATLAGALAFAWTARRRRPSRR